MNEVEYILRIILRARDETAKAFQAAREQLRLFVKAADDGSAKLDKFNKSMKTMENNMDSLTTKLREWRTVMQGLGDENDEAAKSIAKVGKETDSYVKKSQQAVRAQKDLYAESSKLRREFTELEKAEKNGTATREYSLAQYQRLSRELENLSKKLTIGTRDSKRVFEWSQNAKRAADSIIADNKRVADAQKEADRAVLASARAAAREKDRLARQATRENERAATAEAKRAQEEVERQELIVSARRRSADIQARLAAAPRGRRGDVETISELRHSGRGVQEAWSPHRQQP